MSDAVAGVGLKFQRESDVSSGEYDDIAEVTNVGGPEISLDMIEVTNLDSTAGYKEYIAGFLDSGEVPLDMNFTRDSYLQMKADCESRTKHAYRIVCPDTGATTFDFEAFVTRVGFAAPTADKIASSVTLKITGSIDVTS